MKLSLLSILLAALMSLAAIPQASAWSRSGSVTTWRGTYYGQGSGGCAGGTCSRTRSVTGPYGGTVSRVGSITRTGSGSYSYTQTYTGPNGHGATRSGSIRRF